MNLILIYFYIINMIIFLNILDVLETEIKWNNNKEIIVILTRNLMYY